MQKRRNRKLQSAASCFFFFENVLIKDYSPFSAFVFSSASPSGTGQM